MNSPLHLLNGDQLASQLQGAPFLNAQVVFREALLVGPTPAVGLEKFWKVRTAFIAGSYGVTAEEYRQKTVLELEKLYSLPEDTEVCLWFEDDLFCQVNLWFVLFLLADKPKLKLYRVFPECSALENRWTGFGQATRESLEKSYRERVLLTQEDRQLGNSLWIAYRDQDWGKLKSLSTHISTCFQSLEEVCQAQVDRLPGKGIGKPERILSEILASGTTDFSLIFKEFNKQAGIYGFGDLQVKTLLTSLLEDSD